MRKSLLILKISLRTRLIGVLRSLIMENDSIDGLHGLGIAKDHESRIEDVDISKTHKVWGSLITNLSISRRYY